MGSRLPIIETHHDAHDRIVEEAIQTVLSTVDLSAVLERTCRLLNRRFGETRVAMSRLVDKDMARVMLVSDPRDPAPEIDTTFPLSTSAAGRAIATLHPLVIDPINEKSPKFREEAPLAALGYGSLVCFPLVFEGEALGTLDIAHPPAKGLLDCCYQVAFQVSRVVAIALHNSLMVEEIKRLNQLLGRENALLKEELRGLKGPAPYIAESAAMKLVLERMRLAAPSNVTVLITGETGTGKEGLARLVHENSPRAAAPFVAVNLGAIPEGLIESDLFGHEKGAFTGAIRRRPGRFEQAEGGTLFLDEIGDAPLPVQTRLLRALQERAIEPVGAGKPLALDVRVVAATHRDLAVMVRAGGFREDLYYRLNVFPLALPPLRERREEIRPLVVHFVARHSAAMNRRAPAISEATFQALAHYDWPGNVRELENLVERALILSRGATLELPELHTVESLRAETPEGSGRVGFPSQGPSEVPSSWENEVRALLERTLAATGGRVYGARGAAALLGLKPSTLQGKMRRYGITRHEPS
jgi:formate hydrogenlyase transcriptional activator